MVMEIDILKDEVRKCNVGYKNERKKIMPRQTVHRALKNSVERLMRKLSEGIEVQEKYGLFLN